MRPFAPIVLTLSCLAGTAPSYAQEPAPDRPNGVIAAVGNDTKTHAEAYYYYSIARMHERRMQAESAVENYERAAELDPEAAYPHIALANLYSRTRQVEKALEEAQRAVELEPDVPAGQRVLGNLYFSMLRNGGSPDLAPLAIEAFRQTVRLEPYDLESRSHLARLLLAVRKPDEAAEHLEEIVRLDSTAYYEMFLLAQIKHDQGDTKAAIRLLKQSLAVEPRQPEAGEMLVGLLRAEHRFDEIAEVYKGALHEAPADLDTRARLADALANAGQLNEAAEEFQTILAEDPKNVVALVGLAMVRREQLALGEAEKLLLEALDIESDHVLARYTLAGVFEQKREYVKAIGEWSKLVAAPDEGEDASKRRSEYWAHLGFAYEQLGRYAESVHAFGKASELSGGDERFLTFEIQGLLAADEPEEARRALDEALEQFPESGRLRALRARVLDALGEAEHALDEALALWRDNPDDEMFIQAVADVYQNQKRYREAESFLRERLEAQPDNVSLRFQLAAVLERQGKIDGAEAEFERILDVEPESAATLNYLGYMLADHGRRLDESLAFVQKALALDPYNGAYLDSLGWVYFKMGELELAEKNLLEAIDRLRLTGVVYDHLGDLYFAKGDLDLAVDYWEKALEQDDDELEKSGVAQKIERAKSRP